MHRIYHRLLKKVNEYHKYFKCPYLQGKDFDVLHRAIALDKIYLTCVEKVKSKPDINDAGFITYSITFFSCLWLDKYVYIINEWKYLVGKIFFLVWNFFNYRDSYQCGGKSENYNFLTIHNTETSHRGNKKEINLENNTGEIEI